MRFTFILTILILTSHSLFAQRIIKEVELKDFSWAGLHPSGEFYVAADNKISHYNANGDLLNTLSINLKETDSPDGWHLTQFVLFFPNQRQIKTYNPQLEERNFFYIDSVFSIDPRKVAGSFDQKNFWIVDGADNSLKKVNTKIGEVTIDVPLVDVKWEDIQYIREYQQFLFIVCKQHIYLFNGVGKKIKTISKNQNQEIEFYGEEIFLLQESEIQLIDLFTNEKRKVNIPGKFDKILLSDDRLVGFTQNKFVILQFKLPE